MTEPESLQKRRKFLLGKLSQAADEISRIDKRLTFLLEGRKPGAGAA
jgi:hypothetical protein